MSLLRRKKRPALPELEYVWEACIATANGVEIADEMRYDVGALALIGMFWIAERDHTKGGHRLCPIVSKYDDAIEALCSAEITSILNRAVRA